MKFRFSIRGALIATAIFAFYSSIIGLAYQGNRWGMAITFASTFAIFVWIFASLVYWFVYSVFAPLGAIYSRPPLRKESIKRVQAAGESNPSVDDLLKNQGEEGE